MIDWQLQEAIDEKLRLAIEYAEDEYDDPFIVIVAHPDIANALKQNMNPSSWDRMQNVKINGWDIMESEKFILAVVVCGEGASDVYAMKKVRSKI